MGRRESANHISRTKAIYSIQFSILYFMQLATKKPDFKSDSLKIVLLNLLILVERVDFDAFLYDSGYLFFRLALFEQIFIF